MELRREYARMLQPSLISMNLVRFVVPSSCGVHGPTVSAIILDRLNPVSNRAALLVALAVCLFSMGTAQAEPFGPQYRSWEGYDYAPFSPPDRGMGDFEPLSRKRQRAHTKHESRPKAESQRHRVPKSNELEPKAKSQEVAKGPLQIIISIADQRILSLRRWHIDRTLFSIDGSAGAPYTHRRIQRHREGTLASLKYLQRRPHALHAANYLVRDRAACRCLATPSGFTRLHSLGKRLCNSTLASNEARHTGNHCAPRYPPSPDSEPASFFKTENRVQFTRVFGRRPRRERRPHTRDKSYPVSAKCSVARRHKPFTCHRSWSAEKRPPRSQFL